MKAKYLGSMLIFCILAKASLLLTTILWLSSSNPYDGLWLALCGFVSFFCISVVFEIINFVRVSSNEKEVSEHIKFPNIFYVALSVILPFLGSRNLNEGIELWLLIASLFLFSLLDSVYYSIVGGKYVLIKKKWAVLYKRSELEIKLTSNGKLEGIEKKENGKILFKK